MAYIIAVNASIVSDSGGTCECPHTAADPTCDNNPDYMLCTQKIKRDVVTATTAISALACCSMGLFANLYVDTIMTVITGCVRVLTAIQGQLVWRLAWV